MKLDLNAKVKKLEGEYPSTLGQVLAQSFSQATKGDSLKLWNWALKLYNSEVIEIDASDKITITNFVNASDTMANMAKAQILAILNDLK